MICSILLVSWGTSGNLNPLLTAARQLKRRGHRTRIMADPAMRGEIEQAGFTYVSWRRAPVGSAADPSDFSDMKVWLRQAVFDPAGAYAADLHDEVSRTSTDVVICLDILFGCILGAEAAGVPLAILAPHVSIRPIPGIPPASTGLLPARTQEEREHVATITDALSELLDGFLPDYNATRARFGLPSLSRIWDIFDRADRYLLAISRSFDFKADALPGNVRYVGPLLDMPGWSRPWQAPWPTHSGRPRVLVACSTGSQGQMELVQRAIDALGTLDVDAVATTGPNLDPSELEAPDNVTVLQSAPHDAVMKEVSVVVTQGGHGTVCRSLANGRPQLVLPQQRDQPDNAARIEAKGAGLRLPSTASEQEIAAAVTRLISEPHFRTTARRLGAAIRADIAACPLVGEIESIVAARRAAA